MSRTTRVRAPHCPRPPALPSHPPDEPAPILAAPLTIRLTELDATLDTGPVETIPIEEGAVAVPDRGVFEVLSHRDDVPGALGVREVKYLVAGVDSGAPQVFFLNTNKHRFHYGFAREVLNVPLSLSEFNSVTYFVDDRRFLAGTILAHDAFERPGGPTGLYALEFWPTDPVRVNHAALSFKLVDAAMPFAGERLAYHPSGAPQEELFAAEREEFERRGVHAVSTNQIFANITYSPLNLGVGFGNLRVIDGSSPRPPSITDVVIFKTLPNDLSHVAGVLSEEPQTPLSHVNLRAKQNDTPNAYLRDAAADPRIVPFEDRLVRFEVAPDDVHIRAATTQEMDKFLESQRPTHPQYPPRDLSLTEIVDLGAVGHTDLRSIGAKAANVAELGRILASEIVPDGYAVPFSFYDRYMAENRFYERVREIIEDDAFAASEEHRDGGLRIIRRMIKRGKIPDDLREALGEMHARFPREVNPRCRSSTNNEDLVGFNGAGLYDSFTHRPDEGHIEKSIKQVWASLWNFRAFEERRFYRIDHFQTAMAVLVHPNFDNERANGVALTKNIYFPGFAGFYVNAQVGEALVTNPDPNAIPEEVLIMQDANPGGDMRYETIRIRRSSLVEPGQSVMAEPQLHLLTRQMELIHNHFERIYQPTDEAAFAMDLEFKIDRQGQFVIKQARPWVD